MAAVTSSIMFMSQNTCRPIDHKDLNLDSLIEIDQVVLQCWHELTVSTDGHTDAHTENRGIWNPTITIHSVNEKMTEFERIGDCVCVCPSVCLSIVFYSRNGRGL